jgi:hypothetical protein
MPTQAAQDEARALLGLLQEDVKQKKLSQNVLRETFMKLKVLGRNVANVSAIYNEAGMRVLADYAFGDYTPGVCQEALRCIANALLLLPSTRQFSLRLNLDKNAADALQNANDEEEFLLARVLFLLTYDPQIDLQGLISDHLLAESIVTQLARHAKEMEKSTSTLSVGAASSAALSELLKLLFNVTSAKTGQNSHFTPAGVELFHILNHSEIPSPPLQPPLSLLINALANLDLDDEAVKQDRDMELGVRKLITILELSIQKHSSTELDTLAIPLLTVLRNVNESASPALRGEMRARLLPDDQERDQPLGKSSSLASQLLRLTTSSGVLNLTEAISGLMFELSDKDASEYIKNVGYGYAAGYLMTHKIPIPEWTKKTGTAGEPSGQVPINPVTGQRLDAEPLDDLPEMTREEKEREAERLFVLFEKLKATGVVDVKNPVEQAVDEGRFEELSDSDPE